MDTVINEKKNLHGFVFKSKSPSCALRDAKIYNGKVSEEAFSFGAGLFAKAFMERFPYYSVEDENSISDDSAKVDFLSKVEGATKKTVN